MRATLRRKSDSASQQPATRPEDAESWHSNDDDVAQWADRKQTPDVAFRSLPAPLSNIQHCNLRIYDALAQHPLGGEPTEEVEWRAESPEEGIVSFEASVRQQLETLVPGDVYESDAALPQEYQRVVRNVALELQLSVTERNVGAGSVIRVLRLESFEVGVLARLIAYW